MNLGEPIAKGNTATIYLYNGKIIKVFNDNLPDTEAEYDKINMMKQPLG